MRGYAGLTRAGRRQGSDDVSLDNAPAVAETSARSCMPVNRTKTLVSTIPETVIDNNGLADEIFENRRYDPFVNYRDPRFFMETIHSVHSIPVQAKVQSFVRPIPLVSATPPCVFRIEQHARTEDPFAKDAVVKAILRH